MIKIINGKRYNTDTATLVAEYWNGVGFGDFNHEFSELYLTSNGSWFLYYRGGAASQYREHFGNTQIGSEGIMPFTPTEALEYCERYDFVDEIEKYFPEQITEA